MCRSQIFTPNSLASVPQRYHNPWLLPASLGVSGRRVLPRFSLGALNGNQRRSTVDSGTCLKIMVSPVRVRVPPLLFSRYLQVKHNSLTVSQFFYVAL